MEVKSRVYKCTACGAEKLISTNHGESCFDYCPSCSWKANYAPSFLIPQHKHGRLFEYVREDTLEDCPRTLCIHQSGVAIPGQKHSWRYRGEIPCTGPFICSGCGAVSDVKK